MSRVIVVPGEGPEARDVAAAAARVAARRGLPLEALAALRPPPDAGLLAARLGATEADVLRIQEADALERLREVAPDAEPVVRLGVHPFVDIVRRAIETDAALVVKAVEGVSSRLFASLDQHLLRKCPCPVWLRRGAGVEGPKRVLVAVDVAPGAEEEDEAAFDARIVAAAAELAEDGATLLLVHVWEAAGAGLVRLWTESGDAGAAASGYVEDVRAAHAEALERVADLAREASGGRLTVRADLRRGEPSEAIAAAARDFRADLVALGTIGRSGAPGLIIGNTAEDVLNAVETSVLAVKPPGWRSPVAAG